MPHWPRIDSPTKPNPEVMDRLYEFGGLLVYEVREYNELTHEISVIRRTFSEEMAKSLLPMEMNRKDRWIVSYMVQFDGAFSDG